MPKSPIVFSILGCGLMGTRHAQVLHHLPTAAVGIAYDSDEDRMRNFASQFGCRTTSSVEEAISDPEVNAVLIATPSFLHAPMAVKAAREKKHVLIEKPLSTDMASGKEVVSRCEEAGVTLSVVSQKRYGPGVRNLKAALSQGLLGDIFLSDVSINFYRDENYFAQAPWRASGKESGGGVLMNQGIHYMDLLFWFIGPFRNCWATMRSVRPEYHEEDVAAALIEFDSGAIATMTASTVTYPNSPERLTLYGTEGSCTLVESQGITHWDQKENLPLPELAPDRPVPEDVPPKLNSMYRHHAEFVSSLLEGRKPEITPEECLLVVSFVEELYKNSIKRNL